MSRPFAASAGSKVVSAAERALAALRSGDIATAETELALIVRLCAAAETSE